MYLCQLSFVLVDYSGCMAKVLSAWCKQCIEVGWCDQLFPLYWLLYWAEETLPYFQQH